MLNERITENFVRDLLRKNSYYDIDNQIIIEEQKSQDKRIQQLLKTASKSGSGNGGYPEFIISWLSDPNFILVVECKADTKNHESKLRDNPKDYAVDGVLHYAKFLSKEYNVIAIAVSGVSEGSLTISNFLYPCGAENYKPLTNEKGVTVDEIISYSNYYRLASFDPEVEKKRYQDLIAFSRNLHELIWTAAKISEEDKPLLVSGTLIALMYQPFAQTFQHYSAEEMPRKWLEAIKEVLDKAEIPRAKKDTMLQPYAGVATQPNLGKPDAKVSLKYKKGVLFEVISEINTNVWPFINIYHNFDVVGHFYGEFLKIYSG